MYILEGRLGSFQEKECNIRFTYRETTNQWAIKHGFTHEVDVLDDVRYANVKKTVVHIAVDEDANGNPIVERWSIKNHTVFGN